MTRAIPSRLAGLHGSSLAVLGLLAACGSDASPDELWQPCVPGSAGCVDTANAGTPTPTSTTGGEAPGGTTGMVTDTTAAGAATTGLGATTGGLGEGGLNPGGGMTTGSVGDAGLSTDPGTLTGGSDAGGPAPADASATGVDADIPDPTLDAGPASNAVGFVAEHGVLRADGNRIVDSKGEALQLRGMSFFWSQWTDFYVADNVDVLVDDWQATVVRAAIGVENDGGYLQDPEAHMAKLRTVVDRAIERGVYVLIDWHDHAAQNHLAQATAFFQQVAMEYGDQPHVLFEIYNEPVDVGWSVVKSYAEQLVATIRGTGSNNLIIVGTPNWSQDVDLAAADPIADSNVAYTLHFYANTHRQGLRDKAQAALDRGIPLFVTEWGTCSADGNGSIDEAETRTWLNFLAERSISWANWSLHDKPEACSAVSPGGGTTGPWRDDQLTPSGALVKSQIP